jgi:nickel transport protein
VHRPLTVLALVLLHGTALSHGTRIDWSTDGDRVWLQAFYDDGTPMSEAAVTVFPASDPTEAWLSGTTDSLGQYRFTADPAVSLEWDVRVRLAGHGDIVRIDLSGGTVSGTTAISTVQVIVMSVCVVWGLVGTALFFASRRRRGER